MYKFSNGSFYPYHAKSTYEESGSWPDDGVDVDDDVFDEYNQEHQDGMIVGCDKNGFPCWVKGQEKPLAVRAEIARHKRDHELNETSWMVDRHRDEKENKINTTLSEIMYEELQVYRQSLRDWPSNNDWPDIEMPPKPEWLI